MSCLDNGFKHSQFISNTTLFLAEAIIFCILGLKRLGLSKEHRTQVSFNNQGVDSSLVYALTLGAICPTHNASPLIMVVSKTKHMIMGGDTVSL